MTDLKLADEFPAATADDWTALVERVLRGRSFEKMLVGATSDGIEIQPLYTGSDRDADEATDWDADEATVRLVRGLSLRNPSLGGAGSAPPAQTAEGWDVRRAAGLASSAQVAGGWDIRQHCDGTDPTGVRDRILEDLVGGASSVEVGPGIDAADLAEALDGVRIDAAPVGLAPHADAARAEALAELAACSPSPPASGCSLGFDPVGEWARSGRQMDPAQAARLAERLRRRDRFCPGMRAVAVDAARPAAAGATEVQVLAWATAAGVAYLRVLTEAGASVEEAAGLIGFRLPAAADQFATMAMLRAARLMWGRVVAASGGSGPAAAQYQHAVTDEAMYSRRDPGVNLLRGAAAALAAGTGGADAVTVLPFDRAAAAMPGGLGARLARNTQLLLLEEAQIGRTFDPAGGSFYVDSLSRKLAERGWQAFQAVEAAGGIMAVLADGTVAEAIESSWNDRLAALGTRRQAVTGVSDYPLLEEPSGEESAESAESAGSGRESAGSGRESAGDSAASGRVESAGSGRESAAGLAPGEPSGGLPVRRLAQPFEDMRDAADRHLARTGRRPTVAVVALGPEAAHGPRTTWVRNLLAAGGVAAAGGQGDGAASPVEAAAAFAAGPDRVAVITGSDEAYAERAPAAARALKAAGAVSVAMVADPADSADLANSADPTDSTVGWADVIAAGVDELWHDGMDVLAVLGRLHAALLG